MADADRKRGADEDDAVVLTRIPREEGVPTVGAVRAACLSKRFYIHPADGDLLVRVLAGWRAAPDDPTRGWSHSRSSPQTATDDVGHIHDSSPRPRFGLFLPYCARFGGADMRSIWKGAVSFGLVSIPVNMYSATESKNVAFHQVHEADAGRVHMKRVCSVDGEEVPYTEIAKGYETDDGRMVVLSADDFAGLPLPSAKTVEVLEFVPLQIIDPIYFDRSYFLEPQQGGVKAYLLLRDALRESGRVAIAKIAVRQRESLAVLRLYGDVMLLNTMLWPDEVRKPEFGFLERESPRPRPQELNMAETLISALAEESFEPDKYVDEYRTAVESLIEAKIAGNEVAEVTASSEGEVLDLMAALAASVKQRASADTAAAKTTGRKPKSAPRRRSPKTA